MCEPTVWEMTLSSRRLRSAQLLQTPLPDPIVIPVQDSGESWKRITGGQATHTTINWRICHSCFASSYSCQQCLSRHRVHPDSAEGDVVANGTNKSISTALTTANSSSMADPQRGGRPNGVTSFLGDLPPISSEAPSVVNTKPPSPHKQSDLQVSKVPKLPQINKAERSGTATMVPPGGILAGLLEDASPPTTKATSSSTRKQPRGKKPNKFTANSHPENDQSDSIFVIGND